MKTKEMAPQYINNDPLCAVEHDFRFCFIVFISSVFSRLNMICFVMEKNKSRSLLGKGVRAELRSSTRTW